MPDDHPDDPTGPLDATLGDADGDGTLDRALDAWVALAPPADFADRVLDARAPAGDRASGPAAPRPRRRLRAIVAITAGLAAAATITVAAWPAHRATHGALIAHQRTTARLGDRGLAVAEPASELTWRIDDRGAAELEQRAGNVFYRVERGEAFVVHTPAGDVRVTGTCFRIEVEAMKPSQKMMLSGLAGAALATAVLVTVYEGHVIAETRNARTELAAGARATLDSRTGGTLIADAIAATVDDEHATREQLIARSRQQALQLGRLRDRLARLEPGPGGVNVMGIMGHVDVAEPGRTWHDPSPETLAAWVAECRVRIDEPPFDRLEPVTRASDENHLHPDELADYNATIAGTAKQWKDLIHSLYIEATGDTAGAETLSLESMRHEIQDKSGPDEHNLVIQAIARERAGLAAPPADLSKASVYERLTRASAALGDQTEAALAKRVGAERAKAIRGDGWGRRMEMAGCPNSGQ